MLKKLYYLNSSIDRLVWGGEVLSKFRNKSMCERGKVNRFVGGGGKSICKRGGGKSICRRGMVNDMSEGEGKSMCRRGTVNWIWRRGTVNRYVGGGR